MKKVIVLSFVSHKVTFLKFEEITSRIKFFHCGLLKKKTVVRWLYAVDC